MKNQTQNTEQVEMRFKVDWIAGYGDCAPQVFTGKEFANNELWDMHDIMGYDWKESLCQFTIGESRDYLIMAEHIRFTRVN